MIEWATVVNALGENEKSDSFKLLCQEIHESALESSDPDEYNDPVGKTKYYKYSQSGIEIGFRQGELTYVRFYFEKESEYMPFEGDLLSEIDVNTSKDEVIQKLGEPSKKRRWKDGYASGLYKSMDEI